MVKRKINDAYGELRTEDAEKIIDESVIICVFGMSIGSTDKMWWSKLVDWLKKNDMRRLIIYTYKKEYRKDAYTIVRSEREILERFRDVSDCGAEVWDQIKTRIYVGVNPEIVNIKLC